MSTESTPSQRSWSDHPVYVAGASVAGTILICIALYKEVLIPAQMATSDYKINDLDRQLKDAVAQKLVVEQMAEKTRASSNYEKELLTKKLASVKEVLEKKEVELATFKLRNLFIEGGIYPFAFDRVKIGQSINLVEKVYEGFPIRKEDGYFTVELNHPFFGSVVYYYYDDGDPAIYQIMFTSRFDIRSSTVAPDYLQTQLEQAFGEPVEIAEKKYIWKGREGVNIFKSDEESFLITGGDNVPGGWDRVIEKYWKSINVQKAK